MTIVPAVLAIGRDTISPKVSELGIEYFVLFSDEEIGSGNNRCAGVLVYEDIVLTTAQCAEYWEDGVVEYARVGYASDGNNVVGSSTIKRVIKNPSWSRNHQILRGDVAVVVLNKSFPDAFLASYLTIPYFLKDDRQSWIILGAGETSEDGSSFATELQGDEVYTDPTRDCIDTYNTLASGRYFREETHFCAGVDNYAAGACSGGDVGAPLIKVVNGYVYVAGLASFGGLGCGKNDPPFLYTKVPSYSGWITDTICENTSNPHSSCPTPSPTPPITNPPVLPDTLDYIDFFSIITDTEEGSSSSRCGAVLVHDDIVISAAGCTREDDVIRVGYSSDYDSMELRTPVRIVNHPDFFVNKDFRFVENLPNDISVIKLNEPVTGITPVRINSNSAIPQDNGVPVLYAHAGTVRDVEDPFRMGTFVNGEAAGVSKYNYVKTGTTGTKQFNFCQRRYIDLPGFQAKLDERLQFCIQPDGSSPCDADSWGSPLFHDDGDGPVLVGISSQGQCSADGMPMVYTRISQYYNFINEAICILSSDPPSSCNRRLGQTADNYLDPFRNHRFDGKRRPRDGV